ncbi:MAG: hypothetical protein WBC91_12740 [Phototrophicaceae bacterium]
MSENDNIDARGKLEDEPFDYQITKDQRVLLYYENKLIKTLSGKNAKKFISDIEGLDWHAQQLVLAKVTGNFKRGNERDGKASD